MSEDRAERLSDRRSRRKEQSDEDKFVAPQAEQASQTEQEPVTNREHSTFYLDEDLLSLLRRRRMEMNLKLDEEYGFEPEKNRHFRPLLLYLGVKQLEEMSATDIIDALDTTDILDSTGISGTSDE